ncbi:hypothetical protein [uncultured Psychrobacter sp.]|uniref:hypothetical protein n=1 Tax=uncultured Psychrobacter sp. TaxID=259303 RepID=UPI00345A1419
MRIGYYAHHHGSGHCRQADKLAALLPANLQQQMTVFTSLSDDAYQFSTIKDKQVVRLNAEDELPDDVLAGRAGQYWQPSHLHYSPVGNKNIQMRSWQLLNEIRQRQIDLMIIDVSVEVAMLCRAASVPYLYVRLAGERDDLPHLGAFAGALGLLVPYPRALEALMTPDWVQQKSLYLGFLPDKISEPSTFLDFVGQLKSLGADDKIKQRLGNQQTVKQQVTTESSIELHIDDKYWPSIVTVIKGYGGHEAIDAKLPKLRKLLPDALIISLGPIDDNARPFVDIAAHVDDVTPFIAHSDLLLMASGLNAIAQVYQEQTPLVVLPDARPHREQEVMAEALIAEGRALGWQQFIDQMADESHLDKSYQDKFLSMSSDTQDLPSDQSNPTAQKFMDSLVNYDSVKTWFKDWLLPQLKINVEI